MPAERVDAAMYARVFEGHHEGALILADLSSRFYDRDLYVRGGVDAERETAHRIGQREVVMHIIKQISMAGQPDPNEADPAP